MSRKPIRAITETKVDRTRRVNRLILIFDASSGSLDAIVDSAKKRLMIKGCALCAITHGILGEKREWKECRAELGVPIDYLHWNEVPIEILEKVGTNIPCIVAEAEGDFVPLLAPPDVLERCRGSVADLRGRLLVFAAAARLELPGVVNDEI